MTKFIASAAAALMLGTVAFTTPAAAFEASPSVHANGTFEVAQNPPRRADEKPVARKKVCKIEKVVTHRNGKRIVRNERVCR